MTIAARGRDASGRARPRSSRAARPAGVPGVIAQLGERYNGIVEVVGSIPTGSTRFKQRPSRRRLGPCHLRRSPLRRAPSRRRRRDRKARRGAALRAGNRRGAREKRRERGGEGAAASARPAAALPSAPPERHRAEQHQRDEAKRAFLEQYHQILVLDPPSRMRVVDIEPARVALREIAVGDELAPRGIGQPDVGDVDGRAGARRHEEGEHGRPPQRRRTARTARSRATRSCPRPAPRRPAGRVRWRRCCSAPHRASRSRTRARRPRHRRPRRGARRTGDSRGPAGSAASA